MGSRRGAARGRRSRSTGPAVSWAREIAARARSRPRRRLDPRARARRRRSSPTRACTSARTGERHGGLPQGAHVRRRGRRALLPRVRPRAPRRGDRALQQTADGVELGCRSATTCASPSCIASSPCAARAIDRAAGRLHAADHARPLGSRCVRARAIENQAFVIAANQIGPHPGGHALGRALDDRRPVGRRAGAGPRRRGPHRRRARPRAPASRSARSCPRSPTAVRAPTAGPSSVRARALEALDAPARSRRRRGTKPARRRPPTSAALILDAAVRVFARQGFHACRVVGHRRRGRASPTGSSTTTSPPRTRSSTRSSSSAGT